MRYFTFVLSVYRVDKKIRSKKVDGVLNRLHVAMPVPDGKHRPTCIPESILAKREAKDKKRKLERDIELEEGDDYVLDLKKSYFEIPEEERHDIMPEIWEGHNIADYIDPELFTKLDELLREDEILEESGMYAVPKYELTDTMRELKQFALDIRHKKIILKEEQRVNKQSRKPVIPRTAPAKGRGRTVTKLRKEMEQLGVNTSNTKDAHFNKTRGRSQSSGPSAKKIKMEVDKPNTSKAIMKPNRNEMGVKDVAVS